jgi:hypothetical protein
VLEVRQQLPELLQLLDEDDGRALHLGDELVGEVGGDAVDDGVVVQVLPRHPVRVVAADPAVADAP